LNDLLCVEIAANTLFCTVEKLQMKSIQTQGHPVKVRASNNDWQRFTVKVENAGLEKFTMHSLKHFAITLDKSDKQKGSGLTALTIDLYNRSKPNVESVL